MRKLCSVLAFLIGAALLAAALGGCGGMKDDTKYAVVATGKESPEGLVYDQYENGTAVITGRTETGMNLEIPEKVDGNTVTEIGAAAFLDDEMLCTVTLPATVRRIGKSAFDGCASLMFANLGGGVTSIGSLGFSDCKCLVDVQGLESLNELGDYAFSNCTVLCTVKLPECFTKMGREVFYACTSLTGIVLPDGLTSIGSGCFAYCTSLARVSLGGLTEIPEEAFLACSALGSVTLGDKVARVGICSFRNCTNLQVVNLSRKFKGADESAFEGCAALDIVNFGGSRAVWDGLDVAVGNEALLRAHVYFGK